MTMQNKLKILIADDHFLFINGLKLILQERMQFETIDHAQNGKEAIDKCRQHFDIVLMDINMPIIDGIEATREIKRHHPDTKILIVSMLNNLDAVINVMKAGADGFLVKNADPSEFIKAFHAIKNDEIYLSDYFSKLIDIDKSGKIMRKDYITFSESIITPREKSVLRMICDGFTNPEIAQTLFLSVETVNTHRKKMLIKLDLPNTAALVKFAIENKLLEQS
jgi:DNA-binding NarL/FixJ family response regulator